MMLTSIIFVLPVVFLATFALSYSYRWSFRQVVYPALVVIAGIRISALWCLLIAELTGRQSLALLPLTFLQYPEVYFVPENHDWNVINGLLFSAVLLVGSYAIALLVACVNISLSYLFIRDVRLEKTVEENEN